MNEHSDRDKTEPPAASITMQALADLRDRAVAAEAEAARLADRVARVEAFARRQAIHHRALGASGVERTWLDVLALIERAD